MKKSLLILLIVFSALVSHAQSYVWARNVHTLSRAHATAIRQDAGENIYLASYSETANGSGTYQSYLQKTTQAQQLIWSKTFVGSVTIRDIEFNSQGNLMVIGSFIDTVVFDGFTLMSAFYPSVFLLECDSSGVVLWAKKINPVNNSFEPVDLFIGANDDCYFTSELNGGSLLGFCAFHKTDADGNNLQNEFNSNFENRTYSHIISDGSGNVFISGTCGNLASFDSLAPATNESYQHFLARYDANFNAQWLLTRPYITFDHNNELQTDGQNYYWAFDNFSGTLDTIKILKVDDAGNILHEFDGPLVAAFFSSPNLCVDAFGNSTLLINIYQACYLYRYDSNFNLTWSDTIKTQFISFQREIDLIAQDSGFYLFAPYINDTMAVGSFILNNANSGQNYPVDLFATRWSFTATSIDDDELSTALVYPNPAQSYLRIFNNGNIASAKIYSHSGQLLLQQTAGTENFLLNVNRWPNGVYLVKLTGKDGKIITKRFSVQHD